MNMNPRMMGGYIAMLSQKMVTMISPKAMITE